MLDAEHELKSLFAEAGVVIGGGQPWDITVHNDDVYQRVLADGSLGLGETYMLGWWDAEDLFTLFRRLLGSPTVRERKDVGWRTRLTAVKAKLLNVQSILQTHQLADAHYNLSVELFENMLGKSMAYSCGYWRKASDLDHAQLAKYDLICRKLHLKPGERLLDVGCGWGGFARHAAREYGVSVAGITIAEQQAAYARALCKDLPVTIHCKDYREFDPGAAGAFDKIVSIGMIEHVGHRNYRTLYERIAGWLRPEGLFLLHSIASPVSYDVGDAWLTTYIFPGGMLPSMSQLSEAAEDLFRVQDVQNIGPYYTPTLRAWHDRFERYWRDDKLKDTRPLIWESHGTFYRMWRYYLLCCAAEFETGGSEVWQIVYSKGHLPETYVGAR